MTSPVPRSERDWVLLHNRGSRRADAARTATEALANSEAAQRGLELHWVEITDLDSIDWAPARLIAMGGDGTVNAAASWIAGHSEERRPQLAIVPAGTGNNFARDAGLPLDPVDAMRLALSGEHTRVLDLLRFEELDSEQIVFALQSGSIGFPAQVAQRYDVLRRYRLFRWLSAPFGQYVYRWIGAALLVVHVTAQLLGRRGMHATVSFDGETLKSELLALFVNNERSLGGDFFPCPDADPADGIVDLCLLRRGPVQRYPGLFKAVCRGNHVGRYEEAVYRRGDGVIDVELDREMPLLIDGDLPMTPKRLRATLLPAHLSLVTPPPNV